MGKVGAPYGNKNAAGKRGGGAGMFSRGGSYKSGNVTVRGGSKLDKSLKKSFISKVKKSWG